MQRPNILILYTDQQRWDAIGVNGNDEIHTPNLDRLANEGVNFDHYFVQNPVCMPSRLSFLTGRYPSTAGVTHMGVPVPEDTVTLPRLLAPYGYHSANIGKLHFQPHANRDHRNQYPSYGFDQLEISDEPGVYEDAYRAWVKRIDPSQLAYLSAGLPPATAVWYKTMRVDDTVPHPLPNSDAREGHSGRFDFKDAHAFPGEDRFTHTSFVAERTIDYIQQQAKSSGPFLCISGFYSPHSPWVAPQRFLDMYNEDELTLPEFPPEVEEKRTQLGDKFDDAQLRTARKGYYAMVSEVDFHVGRILDTLDDLGLTENTIVIFTSDHGEWLGEHLRWGKGYPAHDVVSRVPLLVRWPEMTKDAGRTVSNIVEGVDVVPTLMECAGIQIPPHLQGESFYSTLINDDTERTKSAALTEHTGWKVLRTETHRYIVHDDGREFLYDLQQPLGEYHDVAGEVGYADDLSRHRHLLLQRLIGMERPKQRAWTY